MGLEPATVASQVRKGIHYTTADVELLKSVMPYVYLVMPRHYLSQKYCFECYFISSFGKTE